MMLCLISTGQSNKCGNIFNEANDLYLEGKRQLGLEKIDEFIDCDPKSWQGYHTKGMLVGDINRLHNVHSPSLDENKFNEALSYLNEALKLAEDQPIKDRINVEIARLHKVYQKFERSIEIGRNSLDDCVDKWQKLRLIKVISDSYMRMNQKDSSLVYYGRGLKVDTAFFASSLGYFYIRELEYDSAFRYLNIALRFDSEDNHAESNIGYCALELGYYDKAIIIYEKLNKKNPDNFNSQNNLGLAYLYSGNKEKALENFTHVRKYYPWNSFLYRNWGIMRLKNGDSLSACRNFQLAKQIEIDRSFIEEINKVADSCKFCEEIYKIDVKQEILDKITDENSVLSEKETFAVATYLMLLEEGGIDFEVFIDKKFKEKTNKNVLVFSTSKNQVTVLLGPDLEGKLSNSQIKALDKKIIAQRFPSKQYHYGIIEVLEHLNKMLKK
ncbi:MAG: hypothetical protein JKY54_19275 [Flavobacteriales bacterium]|nr:hypothetical protein [Flavobacteriales bacterium]